MSEATDLELAIVAALDAVEEDETCVTESGLIAIAVRAAAPIILESAATELAEAGIDAGIYSAQRFLRQRAATYRLVGDR